MRTTRLSAAWVAVLACVLAFGFLGTRGIWDPDEGRYTNVALNMLDTGDWLNPRRNDEVGHWTKPPLTYWAIAASVAVLGANPWAARVPAALAFLLCTWLAWRIARRLAPGSQDLAALAYATMFLPVGAAQMITTDYLLAALETLAVWAFVEARFGAGRGWRWLLLMWAGFALAFLAKGPPALLPLPVLLLFDLLVSRRNGLHVLHVAGFSLFALLALPWYIAVIHGNPGLFGYFIGDEVVNRVTTDEFGRNGEWHGWLKVYAPTLLLGTLPWTASLWRWARRLPGMLRRWWRDRGPRTADAPWLLLALWVLLPLAVFCLARSRLPLYLLPLFVPLAVLVAMQRQHEGRGLPAAGWLLLWVALMLGLRVAAAHWPTHKDAAPWAEAIRARSGGPVREVLFVQDMARYGLHLHLGTGTEIEKISLEPRAHPRFNPVFDEDLREELDEREADVVWVCRQSLWPELQSRIAALGYRARALGAPYQGRVIFRVRPAPAPAPPAAAGG